MKKNTFLKIVLPMSIVLLAGQIVSAQSTGFLNPTDTALPHGWHSPLNGMDSDAAWATAPHTSGCDCPFVSLSWDKGATYTSTELVGIFDTLDSWNHGGSPTDLWGRTAWVDTEFSNTNFRVQITNSSTLIAQDYRDFNLLVPSGAIINGIVVRLLFHGDAGYDTDHLNAMQVNVFYTISTGTGTISAGSNNIELYPNPVHNNLTLNIIGYSQLRYTLFTADGRMMADNNAGVIENNFKTVVNLTGIPPGIYILRLESNKGTEYRKVILQ